MRNCISLCFLLDFFLRFIYLFLAVLGSVAGCRLSLVVASGGLLFTERHGLLTLVASLVEEKGV